MMASISSTIHADDTMDRLSSLKAFDETKAGVKGLVDTGITKVPKIFIQPRSNDVKPTSSSHKFPLIDLKDIAMSRKEIVKQVGAASETLGFFQVINHGIPIRVMEEMLSGTRKFYEEDDELRKEWYTRDQSRRIVYNSNFDLYKAPAANWRDTLFCHMVPNLPDPHQLPPLCGDIMIEYTKHVMELGNVLFELLSESLGLNANHLQDMGCADAVAMLSHYYPICPEPDLTMGTSQHTDSSFLTVLLNDQVSGLQLLYEDHWVNVPPTPGALVVNIGDLLQLVSNDRFVSSEHRVLVNGEKSRVSVACFFRAEKKSAKLYGPIEELLSNDNPPKYRTTTIGEYVTHYLMKGLDGTSALQHFRI